MRYHQRDVVETDLWTREEMILALNLYLKLPFCENGQ